MRVQGCDMVPPLLRLLFAVCREIPASQSPELVSQAPSSWHLRNMRVAMIGAAFPQPVGCNLGVIAKALLTLAQRFLGAPAVLDVGRVTEPFDDLALLVTQRLGANEKPPEFAVTTTMAHFVLERLAGGQCAPPFGDVFIDIV